ncbi:MAG TPA: hypothetical protein VKK79_15100 [Candidatus Lokiarchaeia archaeon]|nr:hypothetical protein [Candidatus Lokiarchaeia archaeon]
MGFIDQCIGEILLGIFFAWAYARKLRKRNKDWSAFLWMIAVLGMWAWGILVYMDVIPIKVLVGWIPWVRWTPGATDYGKDWMWNCFQLLGAQIGVVYDPGLNSIAVILFIAYPMFYSFGGDGGRMLYGRKTYEGGYWWAMAPLRKPKGYKPAQKAPQSVKPPEPEKASE